eukprot:14011323-Alexandrium_andersonii.AAC.1
MVEARYRLDVPSAGGCNCKFDADRMMAALLNGDGTHEMLTELERRLARTEDQWTKLLSGGRLNAAWQLLADE